MPTLATASIVLSVCYAVMGYMLYRYYTEGHAETNRFPPEIRDKAAVVIFVLAPLFVPCMALLQLVKLLTGKGWKDHDPTAL